MIPFQCETPPWNHLEALDESRFEPEERAIGQAPQRLAMTQPAATEAATILGIVIPASTHHPTAK